jgi:hypothetical protein
VVDDYLGIHRRHWDERAPAHAASADYGDEGTGKKLRWRDGVDAFGMLVSQRLG